MTSNTSSITPRSFRRPFRESHNSYCICNVTRQQIKLTTDCIHRRLGLLCSPISGNQLKAESWTAGSPEHKAQWQVDAQIYTQPWTVTMNCQNSNGMSWVSQVLTWKTNSNYVRRAASILRTAKREQIGTAQDHSPVFRLSVDADVRGNDSSSRGRRNWGYASTAFKRDDAVPWHETFCGASKRACTHTGKTGAGSDSGAGCNENKWVFSHAAGPAHRRVGLGTRQAGRRAGGRLVSFNITALELARVSEPVGAGRLF